ncbi:nicotinate (nicotinamide) nucleotide adenylyltransferase [Candidatus Palauibacter sp.]|uniref:nicotinate (nicotinamide) nucleotide adenylyltransferase n=1 Tax=Candidatus Palauibacter sp. TaxID=3101350 RepID=UPI003B524EBA
MSSPRVEVPAGGRRTGILGGSFDPPHVGHVSVARDLLEELRLDRLLVIPAGDPPHREVTLPAQVRLDLTLQAFADLPGIEVSPMEIGRAGPSYTVDTLEALARRFPVDRLILAMGADQFAAIHRWERWRRLPELARIAVMPRGGGEPAPSPESMPIEYVVAHVARVDVSASRIRQRLEEGRSVRLLVPETIRHQVERAWAGRRARHVTQ